MEPSWTKPSDRCLTVFLKGRAPIQGLNIYGKKVIGLLSETTCPTTPAELRTGKWGGKPRGGSVELNPKTKSRGRMRFWPLLPA